MHNKDLIVFRDRLLAKKHYYENIGLDDDCASIKFKTIELEVTLKVLNDILNLFYIIFGEL